MRGNCLPCDFDTMLRCKVGVKVEDDAEMESRENYDDDLKPTKSGHVETSALSYGDVYSRVDISKKTRPRDDDKNEGDGSHID